LTTGKADARNGCQLASLGLQRFRHMLDCVVSSINREAVHDWRFIKMVQVL